MLLLKYMEILFDTHTHSTISDGGNTPLEMLEGAVAKGLKVFALTDHFDVHERSPENLSRFDGAGKESSYSLLSDLKKRDFRIKFLMGIEIGQAHHYKKVSGDWLGAHDYDYVIGSCHIIRNHIDFFHMDYVENNPDAVLEQYFKELQELCDWAGADKKIDSLAHFTYPLRYMPWNSWNLSLHSDAIDEVFKTMINREIALEINTGGLPALNRVFELSAPMLSRYRELGGGLISIGSDSHNVKSICSGMDAGAALAKSAGFTECVYYEKRKPCFIKL
jgi:histidinol-phosphatase (PHP family)